MTSFFAFDFMGRIFRSDYEEPRSGVSKDEVATDIGFTRDQSFEHKSAKADL